jgi:hypothetical protein
LLQELARLEFCRLHFQLDFLDACDLPGETLQRLRRDLHRAGRLAFDNPSLFSALFDPAPAVEPQAQRRYQRPGPPFVFAPARGLPGHFEPGDTMTLSVSLWGDGIQLLRHFAATLAILGRSGLWQGTGSFEIRSVQGEDAAGNRSILSLEPGPGARPEPPVNDIEWWLDTRPRAELWRLSLVTPARLITGGRPLFRAEFPQLFPFILRRVTSMAFAHCGADLVDQADDLLRAAAAVRIRENLLRWEDWRSLDGEQGPIDLGGLIGSLILDGPLDEDLLTILHLGSLFNLGKGAAFATGCYRFAPA